MKRTTRLLLLTVPALIGTLLLIWSVGSSTTDRINTRFEAQLVDGTNKFGLLLPKGEYLVSVSLSPRVLPVEADVEVTRCEGKLTLAWPDSGNQREEHTFLLTNDRNDAELRKLVRTTSGTTRLFFECEIATRSTAGGSGQHPYFSCRPVK